MNPVSILNLKLTELEIAGKSLTGRTNTPSKRILNGKINLLKELLEEINK